MNFIIEYWYLLIVAVTLVACGASGVLFFVNLPTSKQLSKVKEWLVYAVTLAEKELGDGTGQLKLRYVYDMFVQRYRWLSLLISFDKFSKLVDDSLGNMRNMLETNDAVKAIVEGNK